MIAPRKNLRDGLVLIFRVITTFPTVASGSAICRFAIKIPGHRLEGRYAVACAKIAASGRRLRRPCEVTQESRWRPGGSGCCDHKDQFFDGGAICTFPSVPMLGQPPKDVDRQLPIASLGQLAVVPYIAISNRHHPAGAALTDRYHRSAIPRHSRAGRGN